MDILNFAFSATQYISGYTLSNNQRKHDLDDRFKKCISQTNIESRCKLIVNVLSRNRKQDNIEINKLLSELKEQHQRLIGLINSIKSKLEYHEKKIWFHKYRSSHSHEEIEEFFTLLQSIDTTINTILLLEKLS